MRSSYPTSPGFLIPVASRSDEDLETLSSSAQRAPRQMQHKGSYPARRGDIITFCPLRTRWLVTRSGHRRPPISLVQIGGLQSPKSNDLTFAVDLV